MAAGMVVKVMLIAAAVSLMECANLVVAYGYGSEDKDGSIRVKGKVLCQDCTKGYNEWVNGAKPLKGVKVSLTCMDARSRVMYYRSDLTDEKGQFEMSVEKYAYKKKEVNTEYCWVRLVSSPNPACNIFTDFNGGKSGVKLMRPTSIYRNIVTYMMQPFYFTSPMCQKPDDDDQSSDQGQGSKY